MPERWSSPASDSEDRIFLIWENRFQQSDRKTDYDTPAELFFAEPATIDAHAITHVIYGENLKMNAIAEGKPAPEFEASATGGKTINLADLKGSNVILYFYPKDNTPGCTLEGLGFRDHISEFQGLDCVILGVSRDSLRSHDNFRAKHKLPFDLLSDPDENLCSLYDVMKMKNMYGKQVRGIERSTFLIDKQGNLAHQWRKVKVKNHIEEVLEKARELQSA